MSTHTLKQYNAPDAGASPARPAVTHLNYVGDVAASIDFDTPMGPNTMGEALWPVTAFYDGELDRTRVGFSYVAPPDLARCRVCGCTDMTACLGGCSWVESDLCSRCSVVGGLGL